MPGQKGVHEERKTKKPEGTQERTLQASPRHINFISLLRNKFFLFAYQLTSFPYSTTLPPSSRTILMFPLTTTKVTITYATDKYMKKGT
jgi:hypothetical protein